MHCSKRLLIRHPSPRMSGSRRIWFNSSFKEAPLGEWTTYWPARTLKSNRPKLANDLFGNGLFQAGFGLNGEPRAVQRSCLGLSESEMARADANRPLMAA